MSSPYPVASTCPRPLLENMCPIWSKKSLRVPTAPVESTNVSMTTMPRTAMTDRPSLLRMLKASNGLKAIANPQFTTAVLGGGGLGGLDAPRGKVLSERECQTLPIHRIVPTWSNTTTPTAQANGAAQAARSREHRTACAGPLAVRHLRTFRSG